MIRLKQTTGINSMMDAFNATSALDFANYIATNVAYVLLGKIEMSYQPSIGGDWYELSDWNINDSGRCNVEVSGGLLKVRKINNKLIIYRMRFTIVKHIL